MVVLYNKIFRIVGHFVFDASQERQSTVIFTCLPSFNNVHVLVDMYKICTRWFSISTYINQQYYTHLYVCVLCIGRNTVHKNLQIQTICHNNSTGKNNNHNFIIYKLNNL